MSDVAPDEAPTEAASPTPPELLHGAPVTGAGNQRVLHVGRDQLKATVRTLVDDGYRQLLDLTVVDFLTHTGRALPEGIAPERFELVIVLRSHEGHERLRLRVQVPATDARVDSLVGIHPGADAFERESWDLFGIHFEGHPDLSRILMPEEWEGHPLRKDYAVGQVPVQFKGVPSSR